MDCKRPVCIMVGLALLCGCSPYPYSPAIKKVSTSIGIISTTLATNETDLTTAKTAAGRYARRDMPRLPHTTISPGCDQPASSGQPCGQVVQEPLRAIKMAASSTPPSSARPPILTQLYPPAADAYECPIVPATNAPPQTEKPSDKVVTVEVISTTLMNYGGALSAITNAADRAALDSAVGDLSKSVGSMASIIGMAGGPAASAAVGAVATAAVSLGGWIVGQAEDLRRLDALDTTLRATCRPMQTLGATIDVLLDTRQRQIADYRTRSITSIQAGMRPNMTRGEYYARDSEVDALIASGVRPPEPDDHPGKALAKAHDALVKAVINREGQTFALIQAAGELAEQTQKAQAALNKL